MPERLWPIVAFTILTGLSPAGGQTAGFGVDFSWDGTGACFDPKSPPFTLSGVPAGTKRLTFAMKDLEAAMAGIEFRRSKVLLDEIPAAYKDIDRVMENARDLVRIDHTLRQIVNCKGD